MKNILSIIVCLFNEEKTIEKLISKVENCKLPENYEKEIIIIDNNSSDRSPQIIKKYLGKKKFIIKLQDQNYGKGNSILEGIKLSNGNFIVFQDADLEYDPENYFDLLNYLNANNLDAVFGSRSLSNPNYHIYKINNWIVKGFTHLINFLYNGNFTDTATNHKLIKSNVIKSLDLTSRGFDLDFEIAIKLAKNNYKCGEIPINFNARTKNEGKKVRMIDGIKCLWVILKFYFK